MPENISADPVVGKIVAITGGTRGIGRAIAQELLKAGARVSLCGTRQKSVDEAVRALSEYGEIDGTAADISRREEAERFVAFTVERFGGLNVLINNAGVGLFGSVATLRPEEWERVIGINLNGAFYCSRAVLPIFISGGGGDVINISSLAGKNAFAGGAAYNASKFGLNGFSEAMMLDHRNQGIRVSYVMPGSVDTEFGAAGTGAAWKIAPEDVAEVVLMLMRMHRRTTVSRIEIRPSRPQKG